VNERFNQRLIGRSEQPCRKRDGALHASLEEFGHAQEGVLRCFEAGARLAGGERVGGVPRQAALREADVAEGAVEQPPEFVREQEHAVLGVVTLVERAQRGVLDGGGSRSIAGRAALARRSVAIGCPGAHG